MFIVGAWDEIFSAAIDINKAFSDYTGGTLTMSAGLSVFDSKYPISRMAKETEELENRAKKHRHNDKVKDSISLFGLEFDNDHLVDRHTYDWNTFEGKVLGEKHAAIKALFDAGGHYGNSFLYNILELLRQAESKQINIARLAYLLARREPTRTASFSLKEAYKSFTINIYKWALNTEDRRQLITAIMIYVYSMRNEKEDNEYGR